jgi:hypothetical protein
LDAEAAETAEANTMTEKRFEEIRERARVFPFGVPSQVQTDVAELIAEVTRRASDVPFEPEPSEEVAPEPEADEEPTVRRTSGARKK